MATKDIGIKEIGLSVRSTNILLRAGKYTVGSLVLCTWNDLMQMRNCGSKSANEIYRKIVKYKDVVEAEELNNAAVFQNSDYVATKDIRVEEIGLSARSTNVLLQEGKYTVGLLVLCTRNDLMQMRNCGPKSVNEIYRKIVKYKDIVETEEFNNVTASKDLNYVNQIKTEWFSPASKKNRLYKILSLSRYRDILLKYTKTNDVKIAGANISNRAKNLLNRQEYTYMSDILFKNEEDISDIAYAGALTTGEIIDLINGYLEDNKNRIFDVVCGNTDAMWTDDAVKAKMLSLYDGREFDELSKEFIQSSLGAEGIAKSRVTTFLDDMVETNILRLTSGGAYYIVYPEFEEYVSNSTCLNPRTYRIITMRLRGETLKDIGDEMGVTRERVRQLSRRGIRKIMLCHEAEDHTTLFKEDRYRYFYTTYNIITTNGGVKIDPAAKRYFEIAEIRHGQKPVEDALNDDLVEDNIKDSIIDYLEKDYIDIDGEMIKMTRPNLEEVFLKKYGHNEMSYKEFVSGFNKFLDNLGITREKFYYTEGTTEARFWHLSERRYVLWKEGKRLRYYDVDGMDFTELLDTINLGQYENTGFSTEILMRKYPKVMKKYDIHDKCELHNLLRKTIPDGSYNDFHCGRMPTIAFGKFNMNDVMLDLLREYSPIREADLLEIASKKYGYSTNVILANWTNVFIPYRHEGMLCINFKDIPEKRKVILCNALKEDIYTIGEIKAIYKELFQKADIKEINPYSLKGIGFSVTPTVAYRNHDSLYECFKDLASKSNSEDVDKLKKRFAGSQVLRQALNDAAQQV